MNRRLYGPLACAGLLFSAGCDEGLTIGRGSSKLLVDPAAIDFEDVAISLRRTADLELKNEGSVLLDVSAALDEALAGEVVLENVPEKLQPNQKVIVAVHFTPTSAGVREGNLTFSTDSPITPTVVVPIMGRGVEPALVADPAVIDFGRVLLGHSETATATLTNQSDKDVEVVRATLDAFTSSEFAPTLSRITLAPGQSVPLVVSYAPQNLGLDEGRVTVLDTSPRAEALAVRLRGEGVDSDIIVEPTALMFRGLYTGQVQRQTFQITNIGTRDHQVSELLFISTGGDVAGELSLDRAVVPAVPFSVAPGAIQTVDVVYAPSDAVPDVDQIRVASSGLPHAVIVNIDALADPAPTPMIEVTPPALAFGQVEVGQSRPLSLQIANVGTADLTLTATVTIQPAGSPFQLMGAPAGGRVLRPTDRDIFNVLYAPTVTGVAAPAEVVITSNDPTRPDVRVPLTGEGQILALPIIFVSPNPLAFGNIPRGVRSSRPVLVRNDGSAPLTLNLIRLSNDAGGRFTIPGAPSAGTILPPGGGQLSFPVEYYDNGIVMSYSGNLEIQSNAPTGTVNVPITAATEPPPPAMTDIAITLRWQNTNDDVDVHLLRPAGAFFDAPDDCCFCNPNPDWGVAGQSNDNPFLDRDDLVGPGPENINLSVAQTGQYQVVVHFYADLGGGPTPVTVEVRLRGVLVATQTATMNGGDRWIAGRINWNAATTSGTWTGPLLGPFPTLFNWCF